MDTPTPQIRKLRATGGSLSVSVDRLWLRRLGLELGDQVVLFLEEDAIIVEPLLDEALKRRSAREESP